MESQAVAAVRLDVWLDVTCLFKTRSEAQRACKGGKVDVNGQAAQPHRLVRAGDGIEITRPFGRRQKIIVRGVAERHIPRTDARLLYDDLTPPPTEEERNIRRMERAYRAAAAAAGAPDKRARRQIRKLKERS